MTATTTASQTVLVVDDDEITRDVMQEMLHQAGVTNVHLAADGRKALRALATLAQAPDLLICDIYMPDMDGFEFLMALSKMKYSGRIMLVSGVSAENLALARDIAQGTGLSLAGVHIKPLPMETLRMALQPDT
jgi:CheY-like chemotaxis protein